MAVHEFLEFMNKTLSELSKLLGAEPESLTFQQGELGNADAFARTVCVSGIAFQVRLSAEMSGEWLMKVAANAAANCVQEKNVDLSLAAHWFLRQDVPEPYTEETLAYELLIIIYQHTLHYFHGAFNLQLDNFSALSYYPYEGEPAVGTLCIMPVLTRGHQKELEKSLCPKFEDPFPLFSSKNLRQIRKLLAGAGENALFLAPSSDQGQSTFRCYGYLPKKLIHETPYRVTIYGPGTWEFLAGNRRLFQHKFDHLQLWRDPLLEAIHALYDNFGIPEEQSRPLLEAFATQHHGTSVIFIEGKSADKHAVELLMKHKRSLPIDKLAIDGKKIEGQLRSISRIDGAFVIDASDWTVTNIATIVDGKAIIDADLSRGARHSSISTFIANLYSDNSGSRAVAVIFSEDGGAVTVQASQMDSLIDRTLCLPMA